MQIDYQTQTSSDFPFLDKIMRTPPRCRFWTKKRILHPIRQKKSRLRPIRLIKYPEALFFDFYTFEIVSLVNDPEALHYYFYPFKIVLYEQTKLLTRLQLKTYAQHQLPCDR